MFFSLIKNSNSIVNNPFINNIIQDSSNKIEDIEVINKNSKYKFVLFGSRARGDYKDTSDIDIAIKENADISICNHNFVHNDGSKKNIIFEERTYTKKEALKKIILQQTLPWGASWGKIYKRKMG